MAKCIKVNRITPQSDTYDLILPWGNCPDVIIVFMVTAADDGVINLSDYWAVGDSRSVRIGSISANSSGAFTTAMAEQTVEMVLMNVGYMSRPDVHFVVGTKNCLNQKARMNASATSSGSWDSCLMKTDLNNRFYNAIKSYDGTIPDENFRGIFKTFNVLTAKTYNGTTNQASSQKVALFAEKEVLGKSIASNGTEANALLQIKYYETSINRIKQVNGTNEEWWERSPYYGDIKYFCTVETGGNFYLANAYGSRGVAPFMCI